MGQARRHEPGPSLHPRTVYDPGAFSRQCAACGKLRHISNFRKRGKRRSPVCRHCADAGGHP